VFGDFGFGNLKYYTAEATGVKNGIYFSKETELVFM